MKRLVWLWVVLAAVLAVGVGGGLAVLLERPWEDDAAAGEPDGEPGRSGDPTASGSQEPTGRPEPPYVTADLDGNGYGDVFGVFHDAIEDPIYLYALHSTGSRFRVSQERMADALYQDRTFADFDGDGALDAVGFRTIDQNSKVEITPEVEGFPRLEIPVRLNPKEPFAQVYSGWFDDDDRPDLALMLNPDADTVTVSVLRNNGRGFDQPEVWFTRDDSTFASTELWTGDFDQDGLTDFYARFASQPVRPGTDHYQGKQAVGMLRSTGTSFELSELGREGEPISTSKVVTGDFSGTGTPVVAILTEDSRATSVQAFTWDGTQWVEEPDWSGRVGDGTGKGYLLDQVTVSDVNGDGRDDLVYVSRNVQARRFDGYQVALARESGWQVSRPWAPTPQCGEAYCLLFLQQGS